jgi:methionyl-tRNA synthetase
MERVFIGVAWPYANGPIHIGQFAGVYLPADIFARYHRLRGHEVLMVSGSDMHGTPILVTAEKEGASPSEISQRFHAVNQAALAALGISFDLFTDTHTIVHERTVQELFLALLENGFIARKTEESPFCPKHVRFLPDRYVEGTCPHCGSPTARGDECDRCGRILEPRQLGSPHCRLCKTPAEFRPSEHFYLLLDKLAPRLSEYLAGTGHWRPNVTGTTRSFLATGLHPTAITRDLDWGVPLPLDGYPTKRFYVWFDAVIGYLSATREWAIRAGTPDAWRRFWSPAEPVRPYYFLGKDNIFFHTIVWPSILLGHAGLHLPYDVPASEWLQISGSKISKSRPEDADVFLPSLVAHYPADVVRFYSAHLAPQNHDTEFDWDEFHQVTEDVLSNQYGNLVQRILVLIRDRSRGQIPSPGPAWRPDRPGGVGERIQRAHAAIGREFDAVHLKEALELALTEVREENRRIHEARPWQAPDAERDQVLYEGAWLLKAAATWLAPYLPNSSAQVFRMLGEPTGSWDAALVPPSVGQALGGVQPLFPRREPPPRRTPVASAPSESSPAAAPGATAAPTSGDGLDVRVGVILGAEAHPSADKLYVLRVELGEASPRTIVAGVRPFYTPEQLVGRRVAILANLAPRTIRRITSQGMLLAADDGEKAVLLLVPGAAPPGTPLAGAGSHPGTIDYAEFERTPIVVGVVRPAGGAEPRTIDVGGRAVRVAGEWPEGSTVVVRLDAPDAAQGRLLATPTGEPAAPERILPPGTRVR